MEQIFAHMVCEPEKMGASDAGRRWERTQQCRVESRCGDRQCVRVVVVVGGALSSSG